nr:hypothetical protein [Enterocloster clostridioformis]
MANDNAYGLGGASPAVHTYNIYFSNSIHSKHPILHQSINMAHSKNIQKAI